MLFRKAAPELHFVLSLSLSLFLVSSQTRSSFWLGLVSTVAGAPVRAVHAVVTAVEDLHTEYLQDHTREEELRDLRGENLNLRHRVHLLTLQLHTLRSQQELLGVDPGLEEICQARVVANATMITLDRGTLAGIRRHCVVLSGQGLVGIVIKPTTMISHVLPVTNTLSSISVVDSRTGAHGVARGLSNGYLTLQYLSAPTPLEKGDLFITDGRDRLYPPGIAVGRAREVNHGEFSVTALLEPVVNMALLDTVLIVSRGDNLP